MIHPTEFSESDEKDSATASLPKKPSDTVLSLSLCIQRWCNILGKAEQEGDRQAVIITGDSHRSEWDFLMAREQRV